MKKTARHIALGSRTNHTLNNLLHTNLRKRVQLPRSYTRYFIPILTLFSNSYLIWRRGAQTVWNFLTFAAAQQRDVVITRRFQTVPHLRIHWCQTPTMSLLSIFLTKREISIYSCHPRSKHRPNYCLTSLLT